jgi:hypothetical protein
LLHMDTVSARHEADGRGEYAPSPARELLRSTTRTQGSVSNASPVLRIVARFRRCADASRCLQLVLGLPRMPVRSRSVLDERIRGGVHVEESTAGFSASEEDVFGEMGEDGRPLLPRSRRRVVRSRGLRSPDHHGCPVGR